MEPQTQEDPAEVARRQNAKRSSTYRARHPGKTQAARRRWREANPGYKVKRYGMTWEQYEAMVVAQGGLCAVCGNPETSRHRHGDTKSLSVDHCHVTGAVRVLLCHFCNIVVGMAKENAETLKAAATYLEKHRG